MCISYSVCSESTQYIELDYDWRHDVFLPFPLPPISLSILLCCLPNVLPLLFSVYLPPFPYQLPLALHRTASRGSNPPRTQHHARSAQSSGAYPLCTISSHYEYISLLPILPFSHLSFFFTVIFFSVILPPESKTRLLFSIDFPIGIISTKRCPLWRTMKEHIRKGRGYSRKMKWPKGVILS